MTRTLTVTYDKSNEDIPVMCVAERNLSSITVVKMLIGEKAEQLYKELTGQNVIITAEEGIKMGEWFAEGFRKGLEDGKNSN